MTYTKSLSTNRLPTDLMALIPPGTIVVAALIMCFGMLGSVPLFNPDEGLYAEPAREMLETGEYITTLLNYAVRFTKPPLVIWAMALSYHVFGVNEFAARFFVACCAFLTVVITYAFSAKYIGQRAAILAALMLLTSPLYLGVGREAITDMPLVLFISTAIMAFFFAFREKHAGAKWTGYVLVALALMTKGPVGLILPAVIMLAYFYLKGQLPQALRFFSLPTGLTVIALIALPWYVIEIFITKGAYFNEFIMRENFARFTSVVDAHKGPIWYHLVTVMAGFFPWSVFLPQLCWAGWSSIFAKDSRDNAKTGVTPVIGIVGALQGAQARLRLLDAHSELLLLCALSAIIIIAFFSLSVSKLLPYTLPAFPFLAILVASYLDRTAANGQAHKLILPTIATAVFYGGTSLIAPVVTAHMKEAPVELISVTKIYGICVMTALIISVALALREKLPLSLHTFAWSLFVLTCIFGTLLLPEASRVFEEDIPVYARQTAASKDPILVYDIRKPGIPFYSRRKVILPQDLEALMADLNGYQHAYVITRAKDTDRLLKIRGFNLINRGQRFAFLTWKR